MQEEKFLRLNITIKPSKEAFDKAIELSRSLGKQYEPEFILDGKNFYPHITVYSPLYPEKNVSSVIDEMEKLAQEFSVLEMRYIKIKPGQGWIGAEFEYADKIKFFHEAVVSKLNSLREGHYNPKYDTHDYKAKMSQEKLDNVAKYGYPNSMTLYHPHLSIIRLKDKEEAERVAQEVEWDISSFKSDTIAIYKMGEHGTCIELVKEFRLKQYKYL